jgi:hypothetical protein
MSIDKIDNLDISPILDQYRGLESDIVWTEYPNGKQTGLQYIDGDPWTDAVGRLKIGQKWTTDARLNPRFAGTIFEELITKYKITRTRLMWLKPYCCYSMHKDDTPRIHIPLITNDDCYFVFKDEGIANMQIGHVYLVDTTKYHSAMNCSTEWRLHLLGAL